MTRSIRSFSSPDRIVIGTVGLPGERVFYLQVSQDRVTVSLRLEKQQAATLADRFAQVIATLQEQGAISAEVPPGPRDDDPLSSPIEEDFTVGSIGMAWDPEDDRFVLEFHSADDLPPADVGDDDDEAPDTLRVRLAVSESLAFIDRTRAVISAGRPECPLCQLPLEATGHICPRANGYRRSG